MKKKIMFVFALMLMPLQSYAATAWVELDLTALRAGIDPNYHYLYFEEIVPEADPNSCGSFTEATYATANDWKIIHSMALAALLADKPFWVRFSGCKSGRPLIDIVEIRK